MINSKLIRLYLSLDSKDIGAFNKWVDSSIHNPTPIVKKINQYLVSRRKITERSVRKDRLAKYLYGEVPKDYKQLDRDCSKMVKVLERFIQFSISQQDEFENQLNYADYCNKKGLPKLALQALKKAKGILLEQSQKGYDYYYRYFKLEQVWRKYEGFTQRTKMGNLQDILDHLSSSFIIQYLDTACLGIIHGYIRKTDYDTPFIDHILSLCEEKPYSTIPTIQIYYQAYQCLTHSKKENHFEYLTQMLDDYSSVLPPSEIRNLYEYTTNYCILLANTGNHFYIQQGFNLYKKGFGKLIFIDEKGELSPFLFFNTVSLGILLKEFDWTNSFISKYASYLDNNLQESYALYTHSKVYFAQGDYKKAMQFAIQANLEDPVLYIDRNIMLLQIYYEEGNYNVLDSLLNSIQQYINRKNTTIKHRITDYNNIISFTKKLMQLPQQPHPKQLEELENQIKNTNLLSKQAWFLKQLSRLKDKK